MEGREIRISCRRVWISFRRTLILFRLVLISFRRILNSFHAKVGKGWGVTGEKPAALQIVPFYRNSVFAHRPGLITEIVSCSGRRRTKAVKYPCAGATTRP